MVLGDAVAGVTEDAVRPAQVLEEVQAGGIVGELCLEVEDGILIHASTPVGRGRRVSHPLRRSCKLRSLDSLGSPPRIGVGVSKPGRCTFLLRSNKLLYGCPVALEAITDKLVKDFVHILVFPRREDVESLHYVLVQLRTEGRYLALFLLSHDGLLSKTRI
jgi:hypothetical protein